MALVTSLAAAFADVDALIDDAGGLHLTLLGAGWTLLEELSAVAGEQDRVYHSTGEDGTESLYIRATHEQVTNRIHFRTYSFWDAALDTGYNVAGDVAGTTCWQLDDVAMTVWLAATKDSFGLVTTLNAVYGKFFGGVVTRRLPTQRGGRTTIASTSAGFNAQGDTKIYVAAGTDFTKFEIDQYLWIVSQSASPGPASAERVRILGLGAPTRTIFLTAALTYDYAAGALVGSDPQPVVLWGDSTGELVSCTPVSLHRRTVFGSAALAVFGLYSSAVLRALSAIDGNVPVSRFLFFYDSDDYLPGDCNRFAFIATGLANLDDTLDGTEQHIYFEDGSDAVGLKVT